MSFFKKLFGKKEDKNPNSPAPNPTTVPAPIEEETTSFASHEDNPQTNGLDTPIEEVKKNTDGYISLGRSIFPVIKNAEDPGFKLTENINKIIQTPLADGIVICYVIDIGNKLERISENHLKQYNLDIETVHNTAMRNLVDKVNENLKIGIQDYSSSNPEIKPFYNVEFDSNYNPSIMLLSEFWNTTAKEVTKGKVIAVSIPATNIIFFSDFNLMESFRTMRPVANKLYEGSIEDRLELTKNTYIRKGEKWVKFLDTEEQYIELMGY